MKEYLGKKYVFTILFMAVLYILAISNFIYSFVELKEWGAETVHQFKSLEPASFMDASNDAVKSLDSTMNEKVKGRYKYIELFGFYNKVLGKDEHNGFNIVRDNDGFLFYGNLWSFNRNQDVATAEYARRVYSMQQKLAAKGTDLYVLSMPVKSMEQELHFDRGIPFQDYSDVADDYIYYCKSYNLDVLDLRNALANSGLKYEEMFFKTDHHWTPLAGFHAYQYLVEQLKRDGYDLDPTGMYTDMNNYHLETYKECWVGSFGIKTGVNYLDELESITLVVPDYETDFTYSYRYEGDVYFVDEEGSIEDTLIQRDHIYEQVEGDLYNGSAYSTYMNGICAEEHIVNKKNPNGPKVLFIRDSYSSTIAPFFASLCSEVDLIWSKGYGGNIEELVENNDYDMVFVATWPENLEDDSFNFYTDN